MMQADSAIRWIDLARIATVEVTMEDPGFPVESALTGHGGLGWRAVRNGKQLIRLLFEEPVAVRRIQLHFEEPTCERLQEFTRRWLAAGGGPLREIVRQQWNFSLEVRLASWRITNSIIENVAALELAIRPDLGRNEALASLAAWRVA
jgi:hypothetical protein